MTKFFHWVTGILLAIATFFQVLAALAVDVQVADKYLTSTNYSIAEIAELTGYSNHGHFTRAYTKYYSISPSERRKQATAQSIMAEIAERSEPYTM